MKDVCKADQTMVGFGKCVPSRSAVILKTIAVILIALGLFLNTFSAVSFPMRVTALVTVSIGVAILIGIYIGKNIGLSLAILFMYFTLVLYIWFMGRFIYEETAFGVIAIALFVFSMQKNRK